MQAEQNGGDAQNRSAAHICLFVKNSWAALPRPEIQITPKAEEAARLGVTYPDGSGAGSIEPTVTWGINPGQAIKDRKKDKRMKQSIEDTLKETE